MDDLLSEKEQIERLREWWSENGTWVVAGVVLGIGAIVGWNAWQSGKASTRIEASTRFEELAEQVVENRLERAETISAELLSDYPETIYADQARLAMASLYMDQGRDADAARELRSLIDGGNDVQMKMVARLRLAKVLLYQGKPGEVLSLLDGYGDSGFASRYAEAIGDAHYELGDFAAAEAAYLQALQAGSGGQLIDTQLVQMKLNDLPESGDAAGLPDEPPAGGPGPDSGTATEIDAADAAGNATSGNGDGDDNAADGGSAAEGDRDDGDRAGEPADGEPVE